MTVLDIGVIVISLFFIIRGSWVGFSRQIAFLAALSIGYLLAGLYYSELSRFITPLISQPQAAFAATYAIIFFITYVAIILLGKLLQKVMKISFLEWFDRLLGGIFGAAKSALICTLLFMALSYILSSSNALIQKSLFSEYLMQSSTYLTSLVKDKNLQKQLMPKKPAISAFLPEPSKIFETVLEKIETQDEPKKE